MAKENVVDIVIRNVPEKLLREFDEKIVKPNYPGGRSEAIRDLMRKRILERKGLINDL
jgi:metal-responsive CopG/Arc/MetJ family transcriptional regulator